MLLISLHFSPRLLLRFAKMNQLQNKVITKQMAVNDKPTILNDLPKVQIYSLGRPEDFIISAFTRIESFVQMFFLTVYPSCLENVHAVIRTTPAPGTGSASS